MRIAVAAGLSVAVSSFGEAGVKTEEKTRVELGGPLGGILRVFGGKTAKEGIVTTTAVVDDRRLIRSGDAGQIVDLAEEAVYDLDLKKKTYTATSFAELKHASRKSVRRPRRRPRRRASSRPRNRRRRTPRRRSSRSTSRSRGPPRSARSPGTRRAS
jgi:hypothetical protein